ncbi:MAG: hypothetical protein WCV85_01390 [Patescibacteria group bacterium]|jgi:hypothetical protein
MDHPANTYFLDTQRAFEKLIQVDLDERHDANGIDHALEHLARLELVRSTLEVSIHRVANATDCPYKLNVAYEQPGDMAQRLKEICDIRLSRINTRVRAEEMRGFFTDAFLALCWAFIEPKQNTYDLWLAERRNHPFFNIDLQSMEMN